MRTPPTLMAAAALLFLLPAACTGGGGPASTATSTNDADPTTTSASRTGLDQAAGVAIEADVVEVLDGDTIVVDLSTGADESVRLIGINTPEVGECLAAEATRRLTELVGGRTVRLVPDATDRDQFDRLLRYVYVDDEFVNEQMVRDGFAISHRYGPDTAHAPALDDAQAAAERASLGLWSPVACGSTTAAEARVHIVELFPDAPGDDNENLNGEWLDIRNDGPHDLDMTRWGIKDESSSHRFTFPRGFTLGPSRSVRVSTGCGVDRPDALFWCNQGSAVWNNDGDTAFLLDPDGTIVDSRSYEGD